MKTFVWISFDLGIKGDDEGGGITCSVPIVQLVPLGSRFDRKELEIYEQTLAN